MKLEYVPVEGKLPATQAGLYAVPAGARARFHSMALKNTDTDYQLTRIYVYPTGGACIILVHFNLPAGHSVWWEESELPVLNEGDTVWGEAEDADKVEYVFSFIEENLV